MEGLSLKSFIAAIDFKDPTLYLAMLHIMFNPFFWNVIGRIEYNTRFFTKLFGGNRRGCYVAFVFIFSFGISRNLLYKFVVDKQEKLVLENQYIDILGYVLLVFCFLVRSQDSHTTLRTLLCMMDQLLTS